MVGLSEYATHDEQVDVMLFAIEEGRRARAAAYPDWEATAVAKQLAQFEAKWRALREDPRSARPRALKTINHPTNTEHVADAALIRSLNETRDKVNGIFDAKKRLKEWEIFVKVKPTALDASYVAREATYEAARAALPSWYEDGRCPCGPFESCGRTCPNYLLGAQAARCANRSNLAR